MDGGGEWFEANYIIGIEAGSWIFEMDDAPETRAACHRRVEARRLLAGWDGGRLVKAVVR